MSANRFCGNAGDIPVVAHAYDDYTSALADLLGLVEKAKSDLLIADHHILIWYRENLTNLKADPENT